MAIVYALRNTSIPTPIEKTLRGKTVLEPAFKRIRAGEKYHSDNPLVVAHPDLFTDDPEKALADVVEQATARPGEKRSTRRANG